MKLQLLKTLFKTHREISLFGRYIHLNTIKPLLVKHKQKFNINVIGQSVLGDDIHSITLGAGANKILMWSQMHGNESTTTKAIFDLINLLSHYNDYANSVLSQCTLLIIPILNPDGAKAYSRLNANNIDLNRDAQNLSQPESIVLRNLFKTFKPHFCFNLHGQRTIFSAGNSSKTATVSFLSPAQDKACTITQNRQVAMALINNMNAMLQLEIPNKVGVYDDAFNLNCVGDTFQSFNIPTVLFEAGHYKNDYYREEARRFIFQSLVIAIKSISINNIQIKNAHREYALIPENKKLFFDIIIRNTNVNSKIVDIAIQYEERLVLETLKFIPKVVKIEKLDKFYAHKTIEAYNSVTYSLKNEILYIDDEIDCVIINGIKISLLIT